MSENSKHSHFYAIVALCVSFLTLGLVLGSWMGKCSKSKKVYTKKCHSYNIDAKTGSTCNWSEESYSQKEKSTSGCKKTCCSNKNKY